jgi:hypothetical protein
MDKKAFLKAFIVTFVFMLGFLTSNIYADINANVDRPTVLDDGRTDEVPSPSKWIRETQVGVYSQRVILDIEEPQWAMFTDTHSMEPVLSSRSYAIQIVPKSADQINVGDIVSYESKYSDGTIIHRVIEKGYDSQGTYFILQGDNNPNPDPGRIRFEQIKRVVVAIIY